MAKEIGIDIVDIGRIASIIAKYGAHFLERVYTSAEVEYCEAKARPAVHYAGRWAAKEAFYKALPSRCQTASGWKSIEVLPLSRSDSRPAIFVLSSELRNAMAQENISSCLVTISHEKSNCVAAVVLQ